MSNDRSKPSSRAPEGPPEIKQGRGLTQLLDGCSMASDGRAQPQEWVSQERGFTASQMGFSVRLSSLRLGLEGVGEGNTRIQKEGRAEEGGMTEMLPGPCPSESPPWPVVPPPGAC